MAGNTRVMTDKPPSSRLCCPKNLPKKVYNFLIYHPKRNDLAFRFPSMWIKFSRNSRDRCIQSKISRCTQTDRGELKKKMRIIYSGQVFVHTKEQKMRRRGKTLNISNSSFFLNSILLSSGWWHWTLNWHGALSAKSFITLMLKYLADYFNRSSVLFLLAPEEKWENLVTYTECFKSATWYYRCWIYYLLNAYLINS